MDNQTDRQQEQIISRWRKRERYTDREKYLYQYKGKYICICKNIKIREIITERERQREAMFMDNAKKILNLDHLIVFHLAVMVLLPTPSALVLGKKHEESIMLS